MKFRTKLIFKYGGTEYVLYCFNEYPLAILDTDKGDMYMTYHNYLNTVKESNVVVLDGTSTIDAELSYPEESMENFMNRLGMVIGLDSIGHSGLKVLTY